MRTLRRASFVLAALGVFGCSPPPDDDYGFDSDSKIDDDAVATRVVEARILDPHIYTDPVIGGCTDVTDRAPAGFDSANDDLRESLEEDKDGDGYFDLGVVVARSGDTMWVATADCRDDSTCIESEDAPTVEAASERVAPCYVPDESAISSEGYLPPVRPIDEECDVATFERLPFRLGTASLTMSPATVYFREESAMIVGFVDEEEAARVQVKRDPLHEYLPGGTGACADHDDRDTAGERRGWWFHVRFRSAVVELVDAPPFILSGGIR